MKCPQCEIEFETTDSRKIYCSNRCGKLKRQHDWYFRHHEANKAKNRIARMRNYIPVDVAGTRIKFKMLPEERARRQRERYAADVEFRKRMLARSHAKNAQNRGQIKQSPCEKCGSADSQKHHQDYSKPLEVIWLCRDCHKAIHGGSFANGIIKNIG